MKKYAVLIASAAAFVSGAAHATVVNFTNPFPTAPTPNESIGFIPVGQQGTINPYNTGGTLYQTVFSIPSLPLYNIGGTVIGSIPSMSKITFTYTYNHAGSVYLDGAGVYTPYTVGSNTYQGSADTNTGYVPGGQGPSHQYIGTTSINGGTPVPSLPLVWSTANITTPDGNGAGTGTTSIQNNSGTIASFTTTFLAYVANLSTAGGTLSYSVSAIPLPPALPLFAAVIAGMFGFARFYRQRKTSALAA